MAVEVDPKVIIEILKALEGIKRQLQQLIK